MTEFFQRKSRLRWRRRFRRSRDQVEDIGQQAEQQLDQLIFRRLNRFALVRRFVIAWVLLFGLIFGLVVYQMTALSKYYEEVREVSGGIFSEGILGRYTDANPLYAIGSVDSSVSRLLFSGLLKYDENNELVGDLAEFWGVDDKGSTYTVRLWPDLVWEDGAELTAEDVVFTYQTIQNPDAKSPLYGSWRGVRVKAVDKLTVEFILPSALVSFPHSLTTGIVPKHILGDVQPVQLRSVRFNTEEPVGSGPFKLDVIEVVGETPETRQEKIALVPNPNYRGDPPKLERYVIRSFYDEDAMVDSFKRRELMAISGLSRVPDRLNDVRDFEEYSVPLTSQVGAFFMTTNPILGDTRVRQALVQSVDQNEIIENIGYPVVASKSPFLSSHFAYNKELAQLPYDVDRANALLDEAGWIKGDDGYRHKEGQELSFQLYSQSTPDYTYASKKLQDYWQKVGVNAGVTLQSDFEIGTTVSRGLYDVLLYGISVGADPDVFAYWHSSQADENAINQLNFSRYSSDVADESLEAGRSRTDEQLRIVKYKTFLESWRNDAPALMLYQPRYLYLTDKAVKGLGLKTLNDPSERYTNVTNWTIRQARVSD